MDREFGTGPLSQLTGSVYRHAILAVSLGLACLPTLAVTTLLSGSTSNVPWVVLAQLPVAPALSAGLYAVRGWRRGDDVGTGTLFWRGYRLNALDVLRWGSLPSSRSRCSRPTRRTRRRSRSGRRWGW